MGCDPKNKEAVQRLLEIKQRPEDMGLILLGSSLDGVETMGWGVAITAGAGIAAGEIGAAGCAGAAWKSG